MPAQPKTFSIPRSQLARILMMLHKDSGLYIKDVAEQINVHHTTVAKMLKGQPCNLKPIYLDKLCDVYRVDRETRASLKTLAAEAESATDWWYDFNDVLSPHKLDVYINLERLATTFTIYQNERLPGLLQTDEYARALFRTNPDLTPEEVERHTRVRMRRQDILCKPDFRLNAILDEGIIRRALCHDGFAAGHVRHILELSALPNVTIQLVPLDIGIYRGTEMGPFLILDFDRPDDPIADTPVVFLEGGPYGGNLYLQKPEQVALYRDSWSDIQDSALSTAQTRAYLSEVAKEISR
ncbi:helix-turn-helix domain-containing protein [Nocardia sp. NEAU-G5]|uniref:Helix-turn-helix domain-containing protein n=1 Tax=Nocardia albiluteola TaxID=2842303 RepID=A0ABS6BDE7_9NOCA|nr:helix-turn-helix transcriptional regulator [Nocardia albiluteola]MBU3067450.1 helix-turn-helix domain-containing protein [Nocardia albiluteola]